MNDAVRWTLLERTDDAVSIPDPFDVPHDIAAGAALTNQDIRELYAAAPTPQSAALSQELYRMRALLRRTMQFLDLAKQRGLEQSLDITSRNLMRGLVQALENEPAVLERNAAYAIAVPVSVSRSEPVEFSTQQSHFPQPKSAPARAVRPPARERKADERERLFTWKLLPEPGRGAQVWQNVSYRGVVIVRAYDPVQARKLAADKLIAAPRAPEKGKRAALSNPWRQRSLVRVEIVPADSTYDKITVPSVVYP